jgi:hypothetical protein
MEEYRFESSRDYRSLEDRVNALAQDGWQLVNIALAYMGHGHGNEYIAALRRIKRGET